ncbi:MAG: amino acid ABC transporter substrate-binding protein [Candidatus Dormiibacterota bacterium]
MRKPAFLAVTGIVSLGSLSLAACGSNSPATSGSPQAATPITIGVSVSLTGDFSGDGKALVQGYDLWAQDENAKGGLLGHHVTMKYVDDASSTTQVVTNYQNLITQDKVALTFGPFSSLLTIPASTVTNRFGYAFPEPAGGGPSVFTRGIHSLFFVQPAPVEDNLVSFTQWVLSLPAGQRPATAAYSTEDDPFTQPQIDKAKTLLEAGGVRTASYKVYPAETTDFTPLAQQVIAANADVVILGTQEPDAVAFIKAFQQQHYNPKALVETAGPDQGSDFANKVGSANTEGVMVPAGWWSSAKTPFNSTFVSEYIAKYGGTPGGVSSDAAEAYSVGQVVDQAAQKAHSIANAALIAALHTGTYQTIQGPMSFDSVGRPSGASFLVQWQHGLTVPVYPPSAAVAQPEYPKPAFSG